MLLIISSVRKTAPETADLVTFTEEILNEILHFLCSDCAFLYFHVYACLLHAVYDLTALLTQNVSAKQLVKEGITDHEQIVFTTATFIGVANFGI